MRRSAIVAVLFSMLVVPLAEAKDVYLPITGTVGVFRTDASIFNPSYTKTITVQAFRLPVGNVNNVAVGSVPLTIPARQVQVFHDVLTDVFAAEGTAGIRFSSADDFTVTARIWAQLDLGTYGQFETGVSDDALLKKGVIQQLQASGDFRSNVGFLNTSTETATVTLTLYDGNNTELKTLPLTIQPRGVIEPTDVRTIMGLPVSTSLPECWLTFDSDKDLAAYGSVVDAITSDASFVHAVADSGVKTPTQATKEFNVVAEQWEYSITPVGGGGSQTDAFSVNKGDKVILHITTRDVTHGFSMSPYVSSRTISPGNTVTVTFDATEAGQFTFLCTVSSCGAGHSGMNGKMTVNP